MPEVMGITDHFVTHSATQQVVDGYAKRLPLYIPKRHIDGGDCGALKALSGEEKASKQALPNMLDSAGILADKQRFKVLNET